MFKHNWGNIAVLKEEWSIDGGAISIKYYRHCAFPTARVVSGVMVPLYLAFESYRFLNMVG